MSQAVRSAEVRALALLAWEQAKAEGRPCAQVAALFRVATRTIRNWARDAAQGRPGPGTRGRPKTPITRSIRQGVIAMLLVLGPTVGVPELRSMFSTVPYRQLGALKTRLKAVVKRRAGARQSKLKWLAPGATWAMDFTKARAKLKDGATHLLVVRDLASGNRLAIVPSHNERAEVVRETLERLFLLHGAPLVIKHDGGSAFKARVTKALLRRFGVLALRSPAYTPRYNGSCERDIGWAKVRIEQVAKIEGHPGMWPGATIERARELMNVMWRPWGIAGPTPAGAFKEGPRLTPGRRRAFRRLLLQTIRSVRVTRTARLGRMPSRVERDALRRKALQHALCEHNYLEIRRGRLSTPVFGIRAESNT